MPPARIALTTPAPITHRTAEESLGLGYVAAALRNHNHVVKIIDGWLEGLVPSTIARELADFSPLWIGISCYRTSIHKAFETIALLKNEVPSIPVVVGGYGPTFHPEEFLAIGADVVVIGEGEKVSIDLTEAYLEGGMNLQGVPGICFRSGDRIVRTRLARLQENLDDLPFPARDTLPVALSRKTAIHIVSSRGCMARCHFCSVVTFARMTAGPQWRHRSVRSIVDELEVLAEQGANVIKIVDDSFIEPPRDADWVECLADEIARRSLTHLRFRASIRADRVTETLVKALKRAGFFSFSCGIENFSETALQRMHKTASVAHNLHALCVFRKYRMLVQAGHILFDPDTSFVGLCDNLIAMKSHWWTVSKGIFTEMYAAEHTPFTRALRHSGRLITSSKGPEKFTYEIRCGRVRSVYRALKMWHKSHMGVYDKCIDPISAPKAIAHAYHLAFWKLATRMRLKDLAIFESILSLAGLDSSEHVILAFVREQIWRTRSFYEMMSFKLEKLYSASGLRYDAEQNPFVC